MKRIKLVSIVFLSLFAFVQAQSDEVLEKEYQESFTVNKDANLIIESKYGDVYLTAWDKNEIKIEAIIKIESYSKYSRAKDFFDNIEVKISGGSDQVKATTYIPSFKSSGSISFSINYYIKLPETIQLDIGQKYGHVILNNDWKGTTDFDVSYGNLQTRDLLSKTNKIEVAYGELIAENIQEADIDISYSELSIENSDDLEIKTSYSEIELGFIKRLELKSGFDDVNIEGVMDVYARASYTSLDIRKLENSMEIDLDYGDLEVDYVKEGFKLIKIDSDNAGVEIEIDPKASYSLEVMTRYGDFHSRNENRIHREKISFNAYKYTGTIGSSSNAGRLIIDSNYASIEIK